MDASYDGLLCVGLKSLVSDDVLGRVRVEPKGLVGRVWLMKP